MPYWIISLWNVQCRFRRDENDTRPPVAFQHALQIGARQANSRHHIGLEETGPVSSGISKKSFGSKMPALLMRMSISGKAAIRLLLPAAVATSAATPRTLLPGTALAIAATAASTLAWVRPLTTTAAPVRRQALGESRARCRRLSPLPVRFFRKDRSSFCYLQLRMRWISGAVGASAIPAFMSHQAGRSSLLGGAISAHPGTEILCPREPLKTPSNQGEEDAFVHYLCIVFPFRREGTCR